MESLNMRTLASSLPTANLANAEKDLLNNFKAAALSITTLYRSSRETSKRAYNAGYAAACQDLLLMIQQGVSEGGSAATDGLTIGRVIDWIEARLDAIKSREEEEEEEEDEELQKPNNDGGVGLKQGRGTAKSTQPPARDKDSVRLLDQLANTSPSPAVLKEPHNGVTTHVLQPLAGNTNAGASNQSPQPSSPSPPPSLALPSRPIHPIPHGALRPFRSRSKPQSYSVPVTPSEATHTFPSLPPLLSPCDVHGSLADIAVGAKRRHAVMMLDNSSSNPINSTAGPGVTHVAGTSSTRRRTRSARGIRDQNHNQSDAMDVEEDGGRERKRVARR